MEFLGNLIAKKIKSHGLESSTEASIIIARANKHFADIFGSKYSNFIRAKTIEYGILSIEISSSTWAQEFQFSREPFLEKLKNDFPNKAIRNIKIRILGQTFHNPDSYDEEPKENNS